MDLSEEDRKVIEFMEKHYPKYKDNLALGRLLYAKHLGKVARNLTEPEYLKVKVKDLSKDDVGKNVELSGVIGYLEEYVFKVCSVCRHKECRCQNPSNEWVDLMRLRMIIGDETGNIDVLYFVDPKKPHGLEVGKEVVIRGRVKYFYSRGDSDRLEITANSVTAVEGETATESRGDDDPVAEQMWDSIKQIVDFVEKSKKVKVEIVKKMCERHGVNSDVVLRLFTVKEGYVYSEPWGDKVYE